MRVGGGGQSEVSFVDGCCSVPVSATATSGSSGCALPVCPRFWRSAADSCATKYRNPRGAAQMSLLDLPAIAPLLRTTGKRSHRDGADSERVAEVRGDLFEIPSRACRRAVRECGRALGISAASRCPATASFAASMNSSMMRCAMLRSASRDSRSSGLRHQARCCVSGMSKSMEPRLVRWRFRISASSRISSKRSTSGL